MRYLDTYSGTYARSERLRVRGKVVGEAGRAPVAGPCHDCGQLILRGNWLGVVGNQWHCRACWLDHEQGPGAKITPN